MNPPTTLTNHNPPATIGCGLNPNPIRREESDTPHSGRSECWPKPKRTHLERQRERTHHTAHRAASPPPATDERGPVSNSEAHPPDYSLKSYQTRAGSLRGA